MVSKFFGQKIYAFMPIEAGGVNSMLPIAAAARLGMPMVDVDGMGSRVPGIADGHVHHWRHEGDADGA